MFCQLLSEPSSVCRSFCRVPSVFLLVRKNNEWILMNFGEVISTTNILNDYVFGKIGTRTAEQDMTEYYK